MVVVAHVHDPEGCFAAFGDDATDYGFELEFLNVDENDLGALSGEEFARCLTYSLGSASD